eukprot:scaffold135307_cov66-Attheya_sp.AAC.1
MAGNHAIDNEDPTEKVTTIRLVSYTNIRNGRAGRFEAALRAMAQANVDLGVFQETKLTDGRPYIHDDRRGIRDLPHWQVEAYQAYGPNVLSFQLVSGQKRWYVVGAFMFHRPTPQPQQ